MICQLGTGTLYGIIKRLLAEGLVVESKRRPAAAHDDERRRYYRLTPFGKLVVIAETKRLQAMVDAARTTQMLRRSKRDRATVVARAAVSGPAVSAACRVPRGFWRGHGGRRRWRRKARCRLLVA